MPGPIKKTATNRVETKAEAGSDGHRFRPVAAEGQAPEIPIERRQDDAPTRAGKEQRPEPDFPTRCPSQKVKERFELAAVPVQRVMQRERLKGFHDGGMTRLTFLSPLLDALN